MVNNMASRPIGFFIDYVTLAGQLEPKVRIK